MLFSSILSFTLDAAVVSTSIAGLRHFTGFSLFKTASKIKNDNIRTGVIVYLNSGELIFNKGLEMVKNNSSFKNLKLDSNNNNNNNNDQQPPQQPPTNRF